MRLPSVLVVAVLAALALLAAACGDDGGADGTAGDDTASDDTAFDDAGGGDCGGNEVIMVPDGWPYTPPASMDVTDVDTTGAGVFNVRGTTEDADAVIAELQAEFPDATFSLDGEDEFQMIWNYSFGSVQGQLQLADLDSDGCYDVGINYTDTASTEGADLEQGDAGGSTGGETGESVSESGDGGGSEGSTTTTEGTSGGAPDAVIDVLTGLGTFTLDIVSCSGFPDGPYAISGDDGANTVELNGPAGALDIVFTYANGDEVTVDATDLAFIDAGGGTVQFVGDAVGPDGPESLLVEVDAC